VVLGAVECETWNAVDAHVCNIVSGQENLGYRLTVVSKEAVPYTDQTTLSNGSQGLQLGEMLWPLLDIHPLKTDADGTRRHDDDPVAILA
jgi:hypothetical protein